VGLHFLLLGVAFFDSEKSKSKNCQEAASNCPRDVRGGALLLLNLVDEKAESSTLGNSHFVPHVHVAFAEVTLKLGHTDEL
jgi:hypothetical protein